MVYESLTVLLAIALLELMGFGPALMLLGSSEKRIPYAVGIAPAVSIAILNIIGLGLVRFIAPVEVWALPFTLVLVGASFVLVFFWWRKNPRTRLAPIRTQSLFLPIAFFLGCYLILASPLALKGIQYSIFRSNSSDAFTYISLAETLREVPWHVLLRGVNFTAENIDGVKQLASLAPTALITARHVGLPLQLNNMVSLAWFAQIFALPVYTAYFPYHLLAFLNSFLLAVALGDFLKLSKRIKYLAAMVVAIGFWARFVLESDASYEITSMPLLLLLAIAWIQQEQHAPNVLISPTRVLIALAGAALACNYLVFIPFVVLAFAIYYVVNLVGRQRSFTVLLYHGLTVVCALTFLVMTGQLDLIYLNFLYSLQNVDRQRLFPPTVFNLWRANGLNAVWGLAVDTLTGSQRALVRVPLWVLSNAFALGMTVLLGFAGWMAFVRSRRVAEQILFSTLAAFLVFLFWTWASGNLRAAGKAFSYSFPYVVLGLASITLWNPSKKVLKRLAYAVVASWCVLQIALGIYLPFSNAFTRIFEQGRRVENYDLTPLTQYLNVHPPKRLLVSVPRSNTWEFAYYTTFVFKDYPAYFQSGLIVDNSIQSKNLWLKPLVTAPDYAVILKKNDYIGKQHWGERVAETNDLALYRVINANVSAWNEQEKTIQASEAGKTEFEQSIPMLFDTP